MPLPARSGYGGSLNEQAHRNRSYKNRPDEELKPEAWQLGHQDLGRITCVVSRRATMERDLSIAFSVCHPRRESRACDKGLARWLLRAIVIAHVSKPRTIHLSTGLSACAHLSACPFQPAALATAALAALLCLARINAAHPVYACGFESTALNSRLMPRHTKERVAILEEHNHGSERKAHYF
jgi:hypothetical protein